jgi:photosystem II stability/assembly factor-like uncharacterized protein
MTGFPRALGILGLAAIAPLAAGCPESTSRQVTFGVAAPAPVTGTAYVVVARVFGLFAEVARADRPDGPWTPLAPPGPDNIYAVRVDPFAPDSIYVLGVAEPAGESFVFRSDDRGQTWNRLTAGLPAPVDPARSPFVVAPDPAVKDRVWLGYSFAQAVSASALFRSDDRGNTWAAAASGLASGVAARAIAFDAADPKTRLLLTDAGISRTQDAGASWSDFDAGLPLPRELVTLAADPSTPGRFYAIVGDTASPSTSLFRSDAGGAWAELPAARALTVGSGAGAFPADPVALAVDPTNPQRIYLGGQNAGIFASDDAGASFALLLDAVSFVLELARDQFFLVDPTDPARVVAATKTGLLLTEDGGLGWRPLGAAGLPVLTTKKF